MNGFVPKDLPALPVEGDQRLAFLFKIAGGEKDLVANDNGSGMATAGNGGFPADVFFG